MKVNREQITELFGSAPEDQDGKKLVGVQAKTPNKGDVLFHGVHWIVASCGWELQDGKRPVAIYEDTHRPDGTPMEIDPLPKHEGYEVVYFGLGMTENDGGDEEYVITCVSGYKGWGKGFYQVADGEETTHYARLFKVAKPSMKFDGATHYINHPPTTLEDCYPVGNENVWLQGETGGVALALGSMYEGELCFKCNLDNEYVTAVELSERCILWSNSPTTAYVDANEFIAEGGSNE
jgi:hypothetical protein